MENFTVDPAWSDKDSKVEKFRELYERNDFLTAYAAHTDLRMQADPKWAIGRGDEWESHGIMQRDFLIEQGMKPHHRLLDVGCGPGRGARRFVPYLLSAKYTGVDISQKCLEHANALADSEGWGERLPMFLRSGDLYLPGPPYDFIWAHSVFTHLPAAQIAKMIGNVARLLADSGKFLFTYKQWVKAERTGLKQFRYPPATFEIIAKSHGLKFEELPKIWPASQRTGMITRAA
jgi:SAM-dependent methyltransferase